LRLVHRVPDALERREQEDVAAASSKDVETSETEVPCPEIYANCVEGNASEENACTSD
jgi:hypothetical protein